MLPRAKKTKEVDPVKELAKRYKCPITHVIMEDPVVAADGL